MNRLQRAATGPLLPLLRRTLDWPAEPLPSVSLAALHALADAVYGPWGWCGLPEPDLRRWPRWR